MTRYLCALGAVAAVGALLSIGCDKSDDPNVTADPAASGGGGVIVPGTKPIISSIDPSRVGVGEIFKIKGERLMMEGKPKVSLGGNPVLDLQDAQEKEIRLIVPPNARSGKVTVETAAGSETGSTSIEVIRRIAWDKDFFKAGEGSSLHLEKSEFVLNTGNNPAVFRPSADMRGEGAAKDILISIPTVNYEYQVVDTVKQYDASACAEWSKQEKGRNRDCPHFIERTINGPRFNVTIDLNDLKAKSLDFGVTGAKLILNVVFEENGKELVVAGTKRMATGPAQNGSAEADITEPTATLTFDLNVTGGTIDPQLSGFEFNGNFKFDNHNLFPAALLNAATLKPKIQQNLRTDGLKKIKESALQTTVKTAIKQLLLKLSFPDVQTATPGAKNALVLESVPQ